jgi:hypothetical protein
MVGNRHAKHGELPEVRIDLLIAVKLRATVNANQGLKKRKQIKTDSKIYDKLGDI